jgi:hypothetical protein
MTRQKLGAWRHWKISNEALLEPMMAQALAEHCHMVTVDRVFADYDVPVLW